MAQFFIKILILCVLSPCLSFANINNDLFEAVENGNLTQVQSLIEEGANVNTRGYINSTPLHLTSDEEIAIFLIKEGANIEARDNDGDTPLHLAALNGYDHIIDVLIENGAEIHAVNNEYKFTPLHYAVNKGHAFATEALIENGANLNMKDVDGDTPLHLAAYRGNEEIMRLLIENGVDIDATNEYSFTSLHSAILKGNGDIVRFLVAKGANLNMKDKDGDTPLHLAVIKENEDIVRLLIAHEVVDINATNDLIETPLHKAAQLGNMNVMEILIENGADENAIDLDGNTPNYYYFQENQNGHHFAFFNASTEV